MKKAFLAALAAGLAFLGCEERHAGVCSETQNQCGGTAAVTGFVLDGAGMPAADADVALVMGKDGIAKRSAAAGADSVVATGKTRSDGGYSFDKLKAGKYLLKCAKDTLGVTQEFELKEGEKKSLPGVTLVNTGIILGKVDRSIVQQGTGNVAILNEIGQQVNITVNGDFTFVNTPVYNNYTITILVGGKEVKSGLEDKVIKVEPGKTLSVDTSGVKEIPKPPAFIVPDTTIVAGDTVVIKPQWTGPAPAGYVLDLASGDTSVALVIAGNRIVGRKAGIAPVTATVAGGRAPHTFKVTVLATQNGWTPVGPFGTSWDIIAMDFADDKLGYAATAVNRVYKTRDGGLSWDTLKPPVFSKNPDFIEVVDSNTVYLVPKDLNSCLIRTLNGGANWDSLFTGRGYLAGAKFFDPTHGYAYGERGLWWTEDGKAFAKRDSGSNILHAGFLDAATGYTLSRDDAARVNILKSTADSGKTWTSRNIPFETLRTVHGFHVHDAKTLFIHGDNTDRGTALVSEDGGATWSATVHPALNTAYTAGTIRKDKTLMVLLHSGDNNAVTLVSVSKDLGKTWKSEKYRERFYQNMVPLGDHGAIAWQNRMAYVTATDGLSTNR